MESNLSIKDAINNLKDSAMFQMSLGSKELFHSNFLQWIFSIDHEMFKKIVNKLLGYEMKYHDEFTVKREYNNYDLCVVHEEESNKRKTEASKKIVIDLVIENKVKSIPYKEQLEKYFKDTKDSKHLLLTIVTDFTGKNEISDWVVKSYVDLANAMEAVTKSSSLTNYQRDIIEDYISFVRKMNIIAEGCSIHNTVYYNNPYSDELKKLRINDIIEKLRACEAALQLIKRIGDTGKETKSVNFKEMFEKGTVGDVIINYGLTHAQGLFELKVLVKKQEGEYAALLIQVQGNKYCRGIELYKTKTERTDKDNWDIVSKNPDYQWFLLNEKFGTKRDKEYNKYGKEFLYRYREIEKSETVEAILNEVYSDYVDIVNHFKL